MALPLPQPMVLTASFGIATVPDDADEACYKAKRLGKNRVATHDAD